jgi:hypothetical protein
VAAANLASEGMMEVVDDREDINRNQGGRCCLGKSSREAEKKKRRKVAVDKRKMTTGGGEEETNVQEKKKEPREEAWRNEEGKEDIERFLETSWGRFCRDLRSSWGPVVKESHRWRQ